jgi:tetratricopeptide (TPR) repeat protein
MASQTAFTPSKPMSRATALALLLISVVLGLSSLWYGGLAAIADASSLAARWWVSEWRVGRGPSQDPKNWNKARTALQFAIKITPDDPQLYDDLGYLYAERGVLIGAPEDGEPLKAYQTEMFDEAIANYRTATSLRPTFPYSWVYLALSKSLRGQDDDEMWAAFDKAVKFGKNEAGVQQPLARIAFPRWQALSSERKLAITSMVENAHAKAQLQDMAQQSGIEFAATAASAPKPP